MPEWLVEHGIGEDRAILVDDAGGSGEVLAARLQRHSGVIAGLVADARLIARAGGARRGTVLFDSGEEALVEGLPPEAREGAPLRVQVVRARLAEKGRYKRAHARPTSSATRAAPTLAQALRTTGLPVRTVRRFPADPWPELMGEALDGTVGFAGGSIVISPTPAMTLIDVDGSLPPAALARAAVAGIAGAIARLDLAGSIGIDFPTLESREDRRLLDEALSHALASWQHQRTAMNGFGFVQLVSRLERPSLLSAVQTDPAGAGALLLLRRLEDVTRPGSLLALAHPRVIAAVLPAWREEAKRRTGRPVEWRGDPQLALLGGFAQALAS